jgi:hypothetical protein
MHLCCSVEKQTTNTLTNLQTNKQHPKIEKSTKHQTFDVHIFLWWIITSYFVIICHPSKIRFSNSHPWVIHKKLFEIVSSLNTSTHQELSNVGESTSFFKVCIWDELWTIKIFSSQPHWCKGRWLCLVIGSSILVPEISLGTPRLWIQVLNSLGRKVTLLKPMSVRRSSMSSCLLK